MTSSSGTHPTVIDQNDTNLEREGQKGETTESTLDLPPFTHERHLSKGPDQALGVYLTQDFIDAAGPLDVWTKACSEQPIVQLVAQDQAEVVVSVNEKKNTVFTLTNRDSVKYGVQTLPTPYYGPVPPTVPRVIPILCALSRWHYYLRLVPDSRPLKNKIDLEFYKLRETDEYTDEGYPILESDDPNLNEDGVVDIIATTEDYYGIRVVNRSTRDLYIYIFDFSSTGLSINQMNSRIPGSDQPNPTLLANAAITLGYGSASPLPFMFAIDEGVHRDVNVFKMFVSTQETDFGMIEQEDAFALTRESPPANDIRQFFGRGGLWDAFAMTIVQRLSSEGEDPSTNLPESSTTTQPVSVPESATTPETATTAASYTAPESALAIQPTSTSQPTPAPDSDSTAGLAQFTGGSEEPLVVKARSATETSNTWFRTPALTEEFLDSIRSMRLRTFAKQQGPAGATPSEQNGGYFEISVIGPDDLPKLTSPDAETTMTYRSHSAPSTSNHVWTDGVAFERDHELWSKLEVGDRIEVSVCASGRGWTNDAEQGELIFSPGD